jgi:TetR/AcrR family transcriptional regulator, transcriptional repressor for nem operon
MASTPRPDEQRLTKKGRATRERIVSAAAGEMFARGVANTTLDEVKAAAGVSSSQLYHYFADKHALVLAVVAHQTEAVLGGQAPLLSNLDSIDALRAYRDFVVNSQRQVACVGGCPIATLGGELAESDDAARALTVEGLGRWEIGIRGGLRAMQERGDLNADPDRLALTFLAAIQGGLMLTQMRRETEPIETAMDTMIDLIGACLVKR